MKLVLLLHSKSVGDIKARYCLQGGHCPSFDVGWAVGKGIAEVIYADN